MTALPSSVPRSDEDDADFVPDVPLVTIDIVRSLTEGSTEVRCEARGVKLMCGQHRWMCGECVDNTDAQPLEQGLCSLLRTLSHCTSRDPLSSSSPALPRLFPRPSIAAPLLAVPQASHVSG